MISNALPYPHRASALYAQKRQSTPQATPNRSWLFNRGASLLGIACVAERQQVELTQGRLKQLVTYSPETGLMAWRVNRSKAKRGQVFPPNWEGYPQGTIDGKLYRVHRLAFLYMTGRYPDPGTEVDHIDGNRANNKWGNLRLCSPTQNKRNRKRLVSARNPARNITTIRGVNGSVLGYAVRVRGGIGDRAKIWGGYHKTLESAIDMAIRLRKELHGDYANHG